MDLHLKDRIAIVTGASRGLGFATARQLAMEGARVIINSRNLDNLEKAARSIQAETGNEVVAIAGDVTDRSFPREMVEETASRFGGLDILVANAGGPPPGPFASINDDVWQNAIELSFLSQVRLIRESLPYLRSSSFAAVLTITSYSVKQPIPNLVLSNSVRAATVGLTKTLALELGGEGIRFNSILPAWTETERVMELMQDRAKMSGTTLDVEISKQAGISALGRMGRPEEFANAAVFLVSPAASYITGVMLTVDGGMYKGTL